VAAAVASEAASGVQQVVINARLHKAVGVAPAG
jgi:hypothetical protein